MTKDTPTLRLEFVSLARAPGANIAELCRRFRVSRKSGYKWPLT
jgi:transposase-like protein